MKIFALTTWIDMPITPASVSIACMGRGPDNSLLNSESIKSEYYEGLGKPISMVGAVNL